MKTKPRTPQADPLHALLAELLALDPGPRAQGPHSLRARLVSRLYFAGFQVIEEIGSRGERSVPFVLGVKGRPTGSERAILVGATLRQGSVVPATKPASPPVDGVLSSPNLPAGVAGMACALAAMARLREAEVNRPLLFLVAFDEVALGSALLTIRERYGLEIGTALLLHPTGGGVAVASPGLVAFDVALRRRLPEWRVSSLAHTCRVVTRGEGAIPGLLEALHAAAGQGGVAFDPAGRAEGSAGEAHAVLATAAAWSPARGVTASAATPERVGYPFGPELKAARDVWRQMSEAFPGLTATELLADGETLRLTLRLLLAPGSDLASTDVALERAIGSLPPSPELELEVTPRLHRPPFVAGARARALVAAKVPTLAPAESPLPSEAGFAGTPEVLLLGPESVGQGDSLAVERAEIVADVLTRLLTRLVS